MLELVYRLCLGHSAAMRVGSTPTTSTELIKWPNIQATQDPGKQPYLHL